MQELTHLAKQGVLVSEIAYTIKPTLTEHLHWPGRGGALGPMAQVTTI